MNNKIPKQIYPIAIWLFFFMIIPLGIVVIFSFLKKGYYGQINMQFELSNYLRVFEPVYLKILIRSFFLASYTTIGCLILGLPFAYLMARSNDFKKNLLLALIVIPFWTNFIIRVYALKLVLGEQGLINHFLLWIGFINNPIQLIDNQFGVAVGMIYNYIPFMVLPLYVALERLDFTLLDAAYDLGANRIQTLFKVLIPLTTPGIVTGCLFVFIPAFGEFVIPDLLGGAQSMYVGNLITEAFLKSRDWPFGSAVSSFLVSLALLSFYLISRHNLKKERKSNQAKKVAHV